MLECQLTIDDELVKKYWVNMEVSADETAMNSKHFRQLVGKPVWPLGLHGDEASMAVQNAPFDKIWGVFLSLPLFRPTATRTSRYLLFSVASSQVLDVQATFYPLFEAIKNSLNDACRIGVAGQRFIVTELRGDQAWFKYVLRHRSWWIKTEICFRCAANSQSGRKCYANYDLDLPLRTTHQFILEELPPDEI